MLTAQHRSAPPVPEVSAAYLAVKGAALGAKYKERGVKRAELESTLDYLLETGQIDLAYKNAIRFRMASCSSAGSLGLPVSLAMRLM